MFPPEEMFYLYTNMHVQSSVIFACKPLSNSKHLLLPSCGFPWLLFVGTIYFWPSGSWLCCLLLNCRRSKVVFALDRINIDSHCGNPVIMSYQAIRDFNLFIFKHSFSTAYPIEFLNLLGDTRRITRLMAMLSLIDSLMLQ